MSSINHTKSIPYGIVMNQVSKNQFKKIKENKEEWIKNLNLNLDQKTELIHFLPLQEEALD